MQAEVSTANQEGNLRSQSVATRATTQRLVKAYERGDSSSEAAFHIGTRYPNSDSQFAGNTEVLSDRWQWLRLGNPAVPLNSVPTRSRRFQSCRQGFLSTRPPTSEFVR